MHTTQSQNDDTAGFAVRVIRALFGSGNNLTGTFATACANELRSQHGLAMLIMALAPVPRRERTARLIETAATFRLDWATVGVADTLIRMARRPALFRAVLQALCAEQIRVAFPSRLARVA